jgi:hypothetical protein
MMTGLVGHDDQWRLSGVFGVRLAARDWSSCVTGLVIMRDGNGHHARPEWSSCGR